MTDKEKALIAVVALADRLCTAFDKVGYDAGGEKPAFVLRKLGPAVDRAIDALGGRDKLAEIDR